MHKRIIISYVPALIKVVSDLKRNANKTQNSFHNNESFYKTPYGTPFVQI